MFAATATTTVLAIAHVGHYREEVYATSFGPTY